MLPQLEVGGCTPKPKKLSTDSRMMLLPTSSVALTTIGATELGSRWRRMIRRAETPRAVAACVNSCSLRLRNWPRTRRAMKVQATATMISTIISRFCRPEAPAMKADSTKRSRYSGKESTTSVRRMITLSTHPPK